MTVITWIQATCVEWSLVALVGPIVASRMYFQYTRKGRLFWVDGFIILAWLFFVFQTACDWVMPHMFVPSLKVVQTGGHVTNGQTHQGRTKAMTVMIGKLHYSENATFFSCMYMVKFAWLCFFHTLLPKTLPTLRTVYVAVIWMTVIGWAFTSLINVFYCWPIRRRWALDDTYCSNPKWSWIVVAGIHIVTDLFIYFLPIVMLKEIRAMEASKRLGVALIFAMGFGCVGFAIAFVVENVLNTAGGVLCITAAFEQFWVILVACLPQLKGLSSSECTGARKLRSRPSKRGGTNEVGGIDLENVNNQNSNSGASSAGRKWSEWSDSTLVSTQRSHKNNQPWSPTKALVRDETLEMGMMEKRTALTH